MYRRLSSLRQFWQVALRFQRVRERAFRRLDSLRYMYSLLASLTPRQRQPQTEENQNRARERF
jgi:hypothetical protein